MKPARAAAALGLALALASACAHGPAPAGREDAPAPVRAPTARRATPAQVGLASYYADAFHGRRTASGVRYDMHALTCAHPTAPFGTRLRVTDLENGRSVVVTVNDRGPFAGERVIDLSLAAAKKLGMTQRGLARVRVERVD